LALDRRVVALDVLGEWPRRWARTTLEARINPLRSRMRPRLAGSSSVRAKRTSPWRWKKSLSITCT
jgi:hypothetical protein